MQRPQKSGFCEGVVDMDQYYTTGEFARMAHVTIRTIRYYDKKGLLKPSFINESGYRMYSDEDFLKLQKILSLKYLGFSLNEIGNMTIHDTSADILKSLKIWSRWKRHCRIRHRFWRRRTRLTGPVF